MLDELTRELDAEGLRTVVWNAGAGSHRDAFMAIGERAVDGVIFTTATQDSMELHAAVEKKSPIVLINRVVEDMQCDQVTSSNVEGGAAVAAYLLSHGKTTVALIGGTGKASTSRDRGRGFLSGMAEQGFPVPEYFQFDGDFSHYISNHIMNGLLSRGDRPQAVFCANDYMAFGALDALRAHGVRAHDCWVIGYDDVDMAAWDSFSLTTVRQPSREMARAGARLLIERIADPGLAPRRVAFECELIVRGSTVSA
jgi:LacI family transcriptional regulator